MSTSSTSDSTNYAAAAIRISASATDVEQIASQLPVIATRKISRSGSYASESKWIYESDLDSESIEEHIEGLLCLIEVNRMSFQSLPSDCSIDIWCTVSSEREFSGFSLPRALVKRAASLDVEFIFSVYRATEALTTN